MARKYKRHLRPKHRCKADDMRDDIIYFCETEGETVTFHWTEYEGATYNEIYQVWEGGEEIEKEIEFKGIGKVVDYKEDEMEYEWGRVLVGQCLIRLPFDANVEDFNDKQNIYFVYKGVKWKFDNELGIGDWHEGKLISKILKGVKHNDKN